MTNPLEDEIVKFEEQARDIVHPLVNPPQKIVEDMGVEILVDAFRSTLSRYRESVLEEAALQVRGEGEEGNSGEMISVNYAQEIIRSMKKEV